MAYQNTKQILLKPENSLLLGAHLAATSEAQANSEGKKIIKAGTPVGGDTSFLLDDTQTLTSTTNATKVQGIVLHDVDVTVNTSSSVVANGTVNLAVLDNDVQKLYTADMTKALNALGITVVKRGLGTSVQ